VEKYCFSSHSYFRLSVDHVCSYRPPPTDARHFLPVGRSFFSKTDAGAEVSIGGGAVAFLGHFAIVHSTQARRGSDARGKSKATSTRAAYFYSSRDYISGRVSAM
jgi:hypothetical protein